MSRLYHRLQQFISSEMRMSHVYQPVLLAELLKSDGKATVRQIARAILPKDPTQVEYYEHSTKNMVRQDAVWQAEQISASRKLPKGYMVSYQLNDLLWI